jgi:hypothetical protein
VNDDGLLRNRNLSPVNNKYFGEIFLRSTCVLLICLRTKHVLFTLKARSYSRISRKAIMAFLFRNVYACSGAPTVLLFNGYRWISKGELRRR